MRETIQKNPILAIFLIASTLLNVLLGIRVLTQSDLSDRMSRIEVTVNNIDKKVDRLEDNAYRKVVIDDVNEFVADARTIRIGFRVGYDPVEQPFYAMGERRDRVMGKVSP